MRSGLYFSGSLILEEVATVGFDHNNCPAIEPEIDWNSSCETAPKDWKKIKEAEKPNCNFGIQKYDYSFNAYLDANPSMKKWAELNPEMAAKERIKLQSIDYESINTSTGN